MNTHINNKLAAKQGLEGDAQRYWNGLPLILQLPMYHAALERVVQDMEEEAYDRGIPVPQPTKANKEWALIMAAKRVYRAKLNMGIQR